MAATLISTNAVTLTADYTSSGVDVGPVPATTALTWSIDNTAVATLSATTGTTVNINGVANGTANVSVTDGVFTAALVVTVAIPVAGVPNGMVINVGPIS